MDAGGGRRGRGGGEGDAGDRLRVERSQAEREGAREHKEIAEPRGLQPSAGPGDYQPAPMFKKLEESVIEEEYAWLEE